MAEKRAKGKLGRAAIAVSLFKRSGEILEWGCQWSSGGLALYEAIAKAMKAGDLSGKFPHRVCQLLEPYFISQTELMRDRKTMQDVAGFDAAEIILKEFVFAIDRQSAADAKASNRAALLGPLGVYMDHLSGAFLKAEEKRKLDKIEPLETTLTQNLLTALIGLCRTVAFTHRTSPETPTSAEKQSNP